jgi:hypothetical protein
MILSRVNIEEENGAWTLIIKMDKRIGKKHFRRSIVSQDLLIRSKIQLRA